MGMGSTLDTQLLKELKALHVEDLMCRPREEIVALWKDLQVPPPGAADGDWLGYIHHGNEAGFRSDQMKVSYNLAENDAFWLGKSYRTSPGGEGGEGLNRFFSAKGKIRRNGRYKWVIGPSRVDGKPTILGRYGAFNNLQGNEWEMYNELREIEGGKMLCLVYANRTVKGLLPRERLDGEGSEVEFLALTGPVAPWKDLEDPNIEVLANGHTTDR